MRLLSTTATMLILVEDGEGSSKILSEEKR